MEWPKLKNIILIILLLADLFLLGLVGFREWNSSRYQAEARENALQVLEQNGIRMDPAALPEDRTLPVATVSREREKEAELLSPLLGEEGNELAPGGGDYVYSAGKGEALLRNRGEFEISFKDAYPASGDLGEHTVDTLALMRFEGLVVSVEGNEKNGTVTLLQLWNGVPVRTCQVTAAYEAGRLASVSGTRLSGTPVSVGEVELSAVTGLLRFLEKLSDTGDVCTEILVMQAGYQLTASLSDPSTLTPIWYFVTDTGSYALDVMANQLKKL